MAGFLDDAMTSGTRAILADAPARDGAVRLDLGAVDEPAAARAAIEEDLRTRLAGTRATVLPTLRTDPVPLVSPADAGAPGIIVGADAGLADHARLVDGAWPEPAAQSGTAPVPAVLQATAADALGLAVGDTIEAGWPGEHVRFVLTGTWLPTDAGDASWFADPAAATGRAGDAAGPLVVGDWPEHLTAALGTPHARWIVIPAARVTPDDLPGLTAALARLQDGAIGGVSAVTVVGDLDRTLDRVNDGLVTARAIAAIPAVLVALLTVITLARLAALLAESRHSETLLLSARGTSVASLTGYHAAEAGLLALPAAALGAATSALALATVGIAPSAAVLPIAAGTALVAVVTAATVAWRRSRLARARTTGRAARAATVGVTLLVVAAAALALRQFLLYGSPLAPGRDGSAHLDPLAALAPALGLVALALVALLGFGPALGALQALTARSRGLAAVLPARQVGRRPGVFAVALLLVTVAVGGTTIAAAFTGTWSALESASGLVRNGSDVRVRQLEPTAGSAASPLSAAPFAALADVDTALPVLATPARIADDTLSLVALRTDALPAVASALPGEARDGSLFARLQPTPVGVALDPAATRVRASVRVDPVAEAAPEARIDASAWVADADGALTRLALGRVPVAQAGPVELSAPLPAGTAPWRLLAFEATRTDVGSSAPITVRFQPAETGSSASYPATATWNHPTARVMTATAAGPLPVVLSDPLARRLGAQPGASVSFQVPAAGATVQAQVVGTLPYLPGVDEEHGILADLRQLDDRLLRSGDRPPLSDEIWVSTGQPHAVAEQAQLIPHVATRVSTADTGSMRPLVAPVVTATGWGAAGILALAVVAVVSMAATLAAARRSEVVLLRALGVTAAAQARLRVAELGVLIAASFLLGTAAGAVIAALTVPGLARTAAGALGEGLPVPLLVAWPAWGACLAALAVLLAAVGAGYGARIRRQAADTTWREETR